MAQMTSNWLMTVKQLITWFILVEAAIITGKSNNEMVGNVCY